MRSRLLVILALACLIGIGVTSSADDSFRPKSGKKVGFVAAKNYDEKQLQPVNASIDFSLPETPVAHVSPASCRGKTVLNIVAHQDDDLLFINPAISDALAAGRCVRTVFITAGDDSLGPQHMQHREAGAIAAYNAMLGTELSWHYKTETLTESTHIVVATPEGREDVSLIFLRLPDGNLDGSGFAGTHNTSLQKLWYGAIKDLTAIDSGAHVNRRELIQLLANIMRAYQPIAINSQAAGEPHGDHSDHRTTGLLTMVAARIYAHSMEHQNAATRYYIGYPIRGRAVNLSPQQTESKTAVFIAYAVHDPSICHTPQSCLEHGVGSYHTFLSRQYSQPEVLLRPQRLQR